MRHHVDFALAQIQKAQTVAEVRDWLETVESSDPRAHEIADVAALKTVALMGDLLNIPWSTRAFLRTYYRMVTTASVKEVLDSVERQPE